MLQLFDINHNKICGLTNYKDLVLEREINQLDTLSFLYPISDDKHNSIQEECYIRTQDNEYVIKEVNYNDENYDKYVCKVNIEDISGKDVSHFEAVEQTCTDSVNLALAGTGWTIGSCDITKKRTAKKNNCTAFDVLKEIQSAYNCEMTFDAVNKKVYIFEEMGTDKGAYFIDQLNLKAVNQQRNSYDYITRLIPMGKDGLDITSVNSGKNYVENYQYSSKIITAYWEDNRYTVAQDMFDDATERLNYLSKPLKGYSATIYDLAKVSDKYSILDYSLGDTIALINKDRDIKEKQRIVKTTEYLEEPEKNTVQIANKLASVDNLIVRFQGTSDTVDTVTTTDGSLDGSKIDGVDWTKVKNVSIGTADIQDASITTAKIGNAQITEALIADASISNAKIQNAAIGTANIKDAAITNAKIADASIGDAQIQDAAITNAKIANAAIGTANIQNAAIGTAQIAVGAITTALIATSAVGTEQVADSSITDAKIITMTANKITAGTIDASSINVINLNCANLTVGQINGQQIASGAVDSTKLSNDVVTDINSRITQTQLNTAIDDVQIGVRNLVGKFNSLTGVNDITSNSKSGWGCKIPANETPCFEFGALKLKTNTDYTISFVAWNDGSSSDMAHLDMDLYPDELPQVNIYSIPNVPRRYSFIFNSSSSSMDSCDLRFFNDIGANTSNIYITDIMVVEGNKAPSDWICAPEDTQSQIDTAQATADGKNKVHYATSQPSTSGNTAGDIWFDTDDGNKMYKWDGSNWTASQFGTDAIANLSITNALIADATIQSAKIGSVDAGSITTGTLSADRIGALSISSDKLAANSIIAGKIAANAVTAGTIAANAVTAGTIAANAVTAGTIAANAVTATQIAANTITGDKLVADAITAREIASQTITANEIAANTITAAQIAANTITAGQIAAGTITANQIASGTITANQIATGTITIDKLYCNGLLTNVAANKPVTISAGSGNMCADSLYGLGTWNVVSTSLPATATVDLGATVNQIQEISFDTAWITDYRWIPLSFKLEWSTDNSIWTTITDVTNNTGHVRISYGGICARYIRLTARACQSGYSNINVSSFKVMAMQGSPMIQGGNIVANSITADRLAAGTITASSACISSLSAGWITTGTLDASKITVTNLSAGSITGGTMSAARISGGTLTGITISGNTITGGTISGTTLNGVTINGSTINAINAVNIGATSSSVNPQIVFKNSGDIGYSQIIVDSNNPGQANTESNDLTLLVDSSNNNNVGTVSIAGYNHYNGTNQNCNLDIKGNIYFNTDSTCTSLIDCGSYSGYSCLRAYSDPNNGIRLFGGEADFISGGSLVAWVNYAGAIHGSSKSAVTNTKNFGQVTTYSDESTNHIFNDRGRGTFDSTGQCVIVIDPELLDTISTINLDYYVWFSGIGTSDVYLAEDGLKSDYFIVQGKPGAKFMWFFTAERLGYEHLRFNEADI